MAALRGDMRMSGQKFPGGTRFFFQGNAKTRIKPKKAPVWGECAGFCDHLRNYCLKDTTASVAKIELWNFWFFYKAIS